MANEFAKKIRNTWKSLDIPTDLSNFGMKRSHISQFVSDTIELKGALEQNPLPFYEKHINAILNNLLPR